eukprot:3973884-Pleurochrysis_carterae.AAC.1
MISVPLPLALHAEYPFKRFTKPVPTVPCVVHCTRGGRACRTNLTTRYADTLSGTLQSCAVAWRETREGRTAD